MATLSLTVFKAKQLSNGKHKIRIAVRQHHETCYIITPYIIDDLSQFKNGRVVKRYDADVMNVQLRTLLNKYQKIVDGLYNVNSLSAKELKNTIVSYRNKDDNVTISKICNDYVAELREDKRNGYAELIERCGKYFMEFSKGDLPAKEITPVTISNFERFLRNKKKLNQTTIGMYLVRFRVLTNLAKKRYFVKQEIPPFQDCKIPQSLEREIDLTIEQFKVLKSYNPQNKIETISKDLWFLSFYLGGINLIDLMSVDFSNQDEIEYIRTKTRNTKRGDKRIELSVSEEAKKIIQKYISADGTLSFNYKLTYRNFNRYIARTLKKIGSVIGIKRLCYYSARKTFVQYGFELGIPLEVLEYTIGQSMKSNRPIYNYIRIMRKHADNAIRKIIEYSQKAAR
ncbi:site-specific integrase [Prevotella corporis]|uniref:site-specific integrase n=1 Tax=Prevotella corporis TaxID=28128 RepID=UPI0023F01A40|nr:site-specific integrase [Prevotella corporis]